MVHGSVSSNIYGTRVPPVHKTVSPFAPTVVFVCAFALASGFGCGDASTPPRLPTSPPPPAPTFPEPNVTGSWKGTLRLTYGYYFAGDVTASVTLSQTGSSVAGTVRCAGPCFFSGIDVSGTLAGNTVTVEGTYDRWGRCKFEGTISPDATRLQGTYDCGQPFSWQVTKVKTTVEESSSCIPQLLAPSRGALMDNGRVDGRDAIEWALDWTDCPGTTQYSVYVLGPDATIPVVDAFSSESAYRHVSCGAYIGFTTKWRVWLRAMTDDVWGNWSPEYNFDVEPANTDPPSSCVGGLSPR
jgi:hypothetical protein